MMHLLLFLESSNEKGGPYALPCFNFIGRLPGIWVRPARPTRPIEADFFELRKS